MKNTDPSTAKVCGGLLAQVVPRHNQTRMDLVRAVLFISKAAHPGLSLRPSKKNPRVRRWVRVMPAEVKAQVRQVSAPPEKGPLLEIGSLVAWSSGNALLLGTVTEVLETSAVVRATTAANADTGRSLRGFKPGLFWVPVEQLQVQGTSAVGRSSQFGEGSAQGKAKQPAKARALRPGGTCAHFWITPSGESHRVAGTHEGWLARRKDLLRQHSDYQKGPVREAHVEEFADKTGWSRGRHWGAGAEECYSYSLPNGNRETFAAVQQHHETANPQSDARVTMHIIHEGRIHFFDVNPGEHDWHGAFRRHLRDVRLGIAKAGRPGLVLRPSEKDPRVRRWMRGRSKGAGAQAVGLPAGSIGKEPSAALIGLGGGSLQRTARTVLSRMGPYVTSADFTGFVWHTDDEFRAIPGVDEGDEAFYHQGTGKIHVNKFRLAMRQVTGRDVPEILTHELAHAIGRRLAKLPWFEERFQPIWDRASSSLSGFARHSMSEGFAELASLRFSDIRRYRRILGERDQVAFEGLLEPEETGSRLGKAVLLATKAVRPGLVLRASKKNPRVRRWMGASEAATPETPPVARRRASVDAGKRTSEKAGKRETLAGDAALVAGIQRAVAERPGRAEHGNTRTNAFFVLPDGTVMAWDNYYKNHPGDPDAVDVHSHSGANWEWFVGKTGHLEGFDPFNGGDVYVSVWHAARGRGRRAALIMADGRMDTLEIPADKIAALASRSRKWFRAQLDVTYAERSKEWERLKGRVGDYEMFRRRLRQFAKEHGLLLREGLRWRPHPEGLTTQLAPEDRGGPGV